VPRQQTRIDVVAAAGAVADGEVDVFALVEVRRTLRLRSRAERKDRCRDVLGRGSSDACRSAADNALPPDDVMLPLDAESRQTRRGDARSHRSPVEPFPE